MIYRCTTMAMAKYEVKEFYKMNKFYEVNIIVIYEI